MTTTSEILQKARDEWQPIETAPKTGKRFVGREVGPTILVITQGDDVPTIAFWNGNAWDDGDFNSHMDGFTHWMPLPAPPAIKRAISAEVAV